MCKYKQWNDFHCKQNIKQYMTFYCLLPQKTHQRQHSTSSQTDHYIHYKPTFFLDHSIDKLFFYKTISSSTKLSLLLQNYHLSLLAHVFFLLLLTCVLQNLHPQHQHPNRYPFTKHCLKLTIITIIN